MATLATTAAPAFSRIGEGAKAKQTKANLDKIITSALQWYNSQLEVTGMGKFPGQSHRMSNVGDITDLNENRRIEKEELEWEYEMHKNSTNLPHDGQLNETKK